MAVDFSKLLSKPLDDVKKPPPLPAGTFLGFIEKYEFGEANNDRKTPYCRFFIKLTGPGEGIDAGDIKDIDFAKRNSMRKEYYITPDAEWRLKLFIEDLGISTQGRTFAETIPECLNGQVQAEIIQAQSKDGKDLVNYLGDLAGQK